MLLLLLCRCFDVLPKQDDKWDVSNKDNGSCLSRNLGRDSDLDRASCYVIGLSLSPIKIAHNIPRRKTELLSAETCTPSSLLRAWALGLVFEWSRHPLDALFVLGCSREYSDENEIPFSGSSLLPGQRISAGNLL
ncbi:hypothetical protein V6N13_041430 [Hibiscus sabdariffa]